MLAVVVVAVSPTSTVFVLPGTSFRIFSDRFDLLLQLGVVYIVAERLKGAVIQDFLDFIPVSARGVFSVHIELQHLALVLVELSQCATLRVNKP